MWTKAQKFLKAIGMSGVITMGGNCGVGGDVADTLFFVFQIVDVWT